MRLIGLAVILTVSLLLAPLAAATQPEPYTTERISFSSDGFRIVALLGKPAGPGPFPVYISNHGSMPVAVAAQGPWTSIVKNSPADLLATDGYVVLVVARRGYRGSEGTTTTYSTSRDYSGKRAVDVIRGAEAEAHDVVAAVDYLASLPYVDKDRIGIGGVSLGGLVSVIAAARDPRIRAVVSMAGGIARRRRLEAVRTKHGDSCKRYGNAQHRRSTAPRCFSGRRTIRP